MMELEKFYKENILAAYSDISFARLSNPGELIDRSFSLRDIFCPTRMSSLQEYHKFKIRTVLEDDEFINKTEIINENNELVEEILSSLAIEFNEAENEVKGYKGAVSEKNDNFDSQFTDNVDNDFVSLKQSLVLTTDSLVDVILADIAEILSENNKLDADIKKTINNNQKRV